MRIKPGILLAFLSALAVASASAQVQHEQAQAPQVRGAEQQASQEGGGARKESGVLALLPERVRTHQSIAISGRTLSYEAEAGTLDLLGADGGTTARIFYVAYELKPGEADREPASRPVTFVFNGGPGAASAYLHLGALGPRVLRTAEKGAFLPPPQRLDDNLDTWLGMTDLVFVDPVGTGYSRAASGQKPERFWGVEQDASAMGAFIRLYLNQAGRTGSPVYLVGESYGGFRAALLARTLQEDAGISPSGIVLVSPALDFSYVYGDENNPLHWALSLPAMAAAKLERDGFRGEGLKSELAKVERYALTDYLVALARGLREGGAAASARVAEFTGLPLDLVERRFARIPAQVFAREFERADGRVLSPYDANIAAPDIAPQSERLMTPDPVLDRSVPVLTAAFVRYVRAELGYRTDLSYRLLNGEVSRSWDYGTSATRQGYADVLDDLQQARALNPRLKVLIAQGVSDLITPYMVSRYLVRQLPPLAGAEPIRLETYDGGHMMYLRPDSRRALRQDVAPLYDGAS